MTATLARAQVHYVYQLLSLKYLLEQCMVNNMHHLWLSKLQGYDFKIQLRQSLDNKATNALS